ncbi:hypothetical protein M2135_002472 [Parabacteroides sp. PF5-9]|nr:hypothetical protein [Parabacteroides sp. PF5-9]
MNWGWGTDHDGWYSYGTNGFYVDGTAYNQNLQMVYGINP